MTIIDFSSDILCAVNLEADIEIACPYSVQLQFKSSFTVLANERANSATAPADSDSERGGVDRCRPCSNSPSRKKNIYPPTPGGFSGLLDVVRSFVRATAVLAVKRAERHDHARPRTHDHE